MLIDKLQERVDLFKKVLNNMDQIVSIVTPERDFLKSNTPIRIDKKQFSDAIDIMVDARTNIIIEKFGKLLVLLEEINNIEKEVSKSFSTLIKKEFTDFAIEHFFNLIIDANGQRNIEIIKYLVADKAHINQSYYLEFNNICSQWNNWIMILENKFNSFSIFEKLKYIQNNIVMIGSNGSGKSTFSRHIKKILSDRITVIPSQQLLYYKAPNYIYPNTDYIKNVVDYQLKEKSGISDSVKDETQEDFTNLMLALIKDEMLICKETHYQKTHKKALIEQINTIWQSFVSDKKIVFNNYKIDVQTSDSIYSINSLSDGEKAILYYTGHILFAQPDSYIIIDEPENHMHTSLCDKLWNVLESIRLDCTFIYLTHNLDFAVSRNNKTIIWNKSFIPPTEWDFEQLPQNDLIPERLMIELVGSRKNILFCEGKDKSSLDFRLYNSLFGNYTVMPVATREDVIRCVKAYNTLPNLHFNAIGIVDKDNYHDAASLQSIGVFVLPTNEVENVLCDQDVLTTAIETFYSKTTVEKFKAAFFKEFRKNINRLSAEYVTDYINELFHNSFIEERKDLTGIITEFTAFCGLDVQKIFDEHIAFLTSLCDERDYDKALSNCNLKKALTKGLANRIIVDNYEDRCLELINKNKELQRILISKYFSHIPV